MIQVCDIYTGDETQIVSSYSHIFHTVIKSSRNYGMAHHSGSEQVQVPTTSCVQCVKMVMAFRSGSRSPVSSNQHDCVLGTLHCKQQMPES